jgi:uncharacterized XkdX family phage protein
MNWFQIAKNDWNTYHDTARIKNFVVKGKITAEQYQEITGETYVA